MQGMRQVILVGIFAGLLGGCTGQLSAGGVEKLGNVSLRPTTVSVEPSVLAAFEGDAAITTAEDWEMRRAPLLREAIQRDLYGFQPNTVEIIETVSEQVSDSAYGGIAVLDAVTLTVRFSFEGGEAIERDITMAVAKPKNATGPVPVILKMDTCPFNEGYQDASLPGGKSKAVVPVSVIPEDQLAIARLRPEFEEVEDRGEFELTLNRTCEGQSRGLVSGLVQYSLGRYHDTPPVKEAVEQGYAFASIYIDDFVLDSRQLGAPQLGLLSQGADPDTAWGSLAAWAFQYSRGIDYLETDPALDAERMAIYGHSRFGKATLVAGALDPRIDMVIAHQSGRGGAALFNSEKGEPIGEMVENYPQWLNKSFAARLERGEALPFDQHHVLALVAPRPVLIGHGRRDGWADPDGSFRAAKGANPAYALYGEDGFTGDTLRDFEPSDDIAYWMRGGTHGETKEDWEAFFEFLDAHFKP